MRPSPSGGFTDAITAAGRGPSTPQVQVELLNYAMAVSNWQRVGTYLGQLGRSHALVVGDGGVVQAYVDQGSPNANVYLRRVAPGALQQTWTAWGAAIATTAQTNAGVAVCSPSAGNPQVVRVVWADSGSLALNYRDSLDNGVTWGATQVGAVLPGACYGMAGDFQPVLFVAYTLGANQYTVAPVTGVNVGAVWTPGTQYGMLGGALGAIRSALGGTQYTVYVALEKAPLTGFTNPSYQLTSTSYDFSGFSWTALQTLVTVDSPSGTISLSNPHCSAFAAPGIAGARSLNRVCYVRADTGAYTGTTYNRLVQAVSLDGVHWSEGLEEIQDPDAFGATWLATASATYLVTSGRVLSCPAFDSTGTTVAHYKDVTSDVLRLERIEHDGSAGEVVVTLANASGAYSTAPVLAPNTVVRVSEGYVPAGGYQGAAGNVIYTGVYYLEDWSYARVSDTSELTLRARDGRRKMDRQSRFPLTYTGQTVAWLISEIAARAGHVVAVQVGSAATAQFTQVVNSFTVTAGETWERAMHRLGELHGFSWAMQTLNVGTTTYGGLAATVGQAGGDQVVYKEKVPSDAAVWSYQPEPELYHLIKSGERANHVIVYGLSTPGVGSFPATVVGAEAWDGGNVAVTGVERYAHVTDRLLTSNTMAGIRATLDLQYEQRVAIAGEVVVPDNPLLELWDVVTVTEATVSPGGQALRVAGLHYRFDVLHAVNDLTVVLEGV